jgi:hypothetical protein
VVCHNCQQPRHYTREFPLPLATCMYCRTSNHDTEECLALLLMGPKSLESIVGTKPTTEAQLDSTVFKMEWFSRSCDPANLSMGFVFLCEGSSFS